ncbi:MAG: carboxypeptidase-like regulatory domain-containing protein, partial [Lewinella sp.]|nr:carboxypeptidase-like regulatory domain-containing protein [Lewinella sp.]
MNNKILFTATLLLMTGLLAAQGEKAIVTGQVRDAVSEKPIDLALIYVLGSNTAVETATNGRYRIEIPADTAITLVFSRIGFQETRVEVTPT